MAVTRAEIHDEVHAVEGAQLAGDYEAQVIDAKVARKEPGALLLLGKSYAWSLTQSIIVVTIIAITSPASPCLCHPSPVGTFAKPNPTLRHHLQGPSHSELDQLQCRGGCIYASGN